MYRHPHSFCMVEYTNRKRSSFITVMVVLSSRFNIQVDAAEGDIAALIRGVDWEILFFSLFSI